MTTLLLVRHGRSTSNAAGTLAGRAPGVLLDETGRSQAMTVGERLRGARVDALVASPITRCQETAQLLADSAALGLELRTDEHFTECDYGEWTGRGLAELATEPLWATVQATPSQVRFPGGESMQEMADRMVAGVQAVNRELEASSAEGAEPVWVLVSHGDPIKAVLSHALGQRLDDFQRIVVDPASVSIVRYPAASEGAHRAPLVVAMNTTAGQLRDRLGGAAGPQVGGGLGSQQDA
ncbi:MSMEG_4193 family putative phosphomutase [Luteococcus peritonei]|uniref:MSMEG_4193 family putative phosphomutase n=1 Tax=Luteococcus peritonei TaxID=88874 RepID=A0ABW4RXU1_9ACTN